MFRPFARRWTRIGSVWIDNLTWMTTESAAAPKYRRIAADLGERIRAGQYPSGSVLPPQRKLSEEYSVTLMTMRQALQVLEADGLIAQQAGRGTFVLPLPLSHHLQSLRSLADELSAQGIALRTDVLGRQDRKLPKDVETRVGAAGGRGLRLERLRTVDGQALVHQVSWVPEPWGLQVRDCDFTVEPLYAALKRVCGLEVARAQETLVAQGLSERLATALGLPVGRPVLVMERTTYDDLDRAFVADTAVILDARIRVVTERRPASVTNQWQLT
jgi:GntR family transcriptional regulator